MGADAAVNSSTIKPAAIKARKILRNVIMLPT
jgi:hypothetical protein